MKEKIKALIKRAYESLESAKLTVNNGYNDASVSTALESSVEPIRC